MLKPLMTVIDIERFIDENIKHVEYKKGLCGHNLDYLDGMHDVLREIKETYFN